MFRTLSLSRRYSSISNVDKILNRAHTTPRPKDPAYFTGNPFYYHNLIQLHRFLRDFPPLASPDTFNGWLSFEEMKSKLNMRLNEVEYKEFIQKLNLLWNYKSHNEDISPFLSKFLKSEMRLEESKPVPLTVDEHGRSFTYGSRKTAKAQVWMIQGPGHIYVNGQHFSDYFVNQQELEAVMRPFDRIGMYGKFNVWAIVNGSGNTSQADAVMAGVARGLAVHHPEFKEMLLDLIKLDTRQVERKKTGQPKARKKITWYLFFYFSLTLVG